jgi:hypothetical protein
VLDRQYHPFDYSFEATSLMSSSSPEDWSAIDGLLPEKERELAGYLDVPLAGPALAVFQAYLDEALGGREGYFERIDAILRSFGTFQYEIGFDDDVSTQKMVTFLTETRTGDCTEFSNTAAILARLAGIPSRVVVGYLASRDLQTERHQQGVFVLREMIEPLKRFDPEDLYLVTTAHHHSWVQYYMPGYGWVDFETTGFAIPPSGSGDPNDMNVVIPILDPQRNPRLTRPFPWLFVLKSLLVLLGATGLGLYVYRYSREGWLAARSRRADLGGLRALQTLLLMRLAADGYSVKQPSQTPLEYADRYPQTREFAEAYTSLRYREEAAVPQSNGLWSRLHASYRQVLSRMRRRGTGAFFRRLFSLKGLFY